MKKFLYSVMLLAGVIMFVSCDHEFLGPKDEIGETTAVSMSGEWYISVQCMDADDNVVFEDEDLWEMGKFLILTSNVSDNNSNQLIIQDNGNLFSYSEEYLSPFRCKVDADFSENSFDCVDTDKYIYATLNYNDGEDDDTWTTNNWYFTASELAKGDSVEFEGDYYFPEDMTCHFCYGSGTPDRAINIDSEGNEVFEYDSNVEIWGGKILKNAGHQNNGTLSDSIVFNYRSDDYYFQYFSTKYGYDHFRISGIRFSGLVEND